MKLAIALVLVLTMAANARAQTPDSACTYDRCALWLRPPVILAGMPGMRLRGGSSALLRHVASSDSALANAKIYAHRKKVGDRLFWSGVVASGAALTMLTTRRHHLDPYEFDDANGPELALMGTGLVAMYVGVPFSISAHRALQRAIWWYNRDLPR
jgi:hypothetical protein